MACYVYKCEACGVFDHHAALGQAPPSVDCRCGRFAPRYFGRDAMPQIAATDPFRAYDLSPRKEAAQVQQQRYVDAPRDRFEAKRLERDTGKVYVGDDTSGMSAAARRGIERAKEKAK